MVYPLAVICIFILNFEQENYQQMTTEPNTQGIHDLVKPSAGGLLPLKRPVDLITIAATMPYIFGVSSLNLGCAPVSAFLGVSSILIKLSDKRVVNVVMPDENDAVRSHRAAFNTAAGSFIKNQVASVAMNLLSVPALAVGYIGMMGDSKMAAAGLTGSFLLAVGGAVAGWRAHSKALEMSRNETAIKIERLNLKQG